MFCSTTSAVFRQPHGWEVSGLWYSYPCPYQKRFYKLHTVPICSKNMVYKPSRAWAWVWMSQPSKGLRCCFGRRPAAAPAFASVHITLLTLLDVCESSLRRGHADLLCIVPIWKNDPRRESASVHITWCRRRNVFCIDRRVQCCTPRPKVRDEGPVYGACNQHPQRLEVSVQLFAC